MDDLVANFADQSIKAPDDLLNSFSDHKTESPNEDAYKYHFVDGSPAGSEHGRVAHPTAYPSMENNDSLLHIEEEGQQSTDYENENENENETGYNADIDEDDDAPAPSDNGENGFDDFAQRLIRLHRQDIDRDELLTQLHQENMDLKRALKESVPGGNPRAEAAERSLFEIRRSLATNPYVCVLIDGRGYKIHENLLQLGKRGGSEAADLLWAEVSNYLQQFGDAEHWEIMVQLYIDIGGLLARCVSADIPVSNDNVRDFMLGFNQAEPLFTIVDMGRGSEKLSRKVEGMFHLFVNNVQCKHLVFGCCHNRDYAVALEPYLSNPITVSTITLLKSYEDNTYYESLPFNSVAFPHVFRSTPFRATDRLGEAIDYMQDLPQPSNGITREVEKFSENEIAGENEALAKWQAASNASIPVPTRNPRPTNPRPRSTWGSNQTVLLNINDERVDPPLLEEDYDTAEDMKDLMEVQRFCHFYHLTGNCALQNLGPKQECKFRHGPKLNLNETLVLRNYVKDMPCPRGSKCRIGDCMFGHTCHEQPGCTKGTRCPLYKFHKVDPTVVKVGPSWQAFGNQSPQRR